MTGCDARVQASNHSLSLPGEDTGKDLSTTTWQPLARIILKQLQVTNNIYNSEMRIVIGTRRGAMN